MEQRALVGQSVAEYRQAQGLGHPRVRHRVDQKPFYDATAPVRAKVRRPARRSDEARQPTSSKGSDTVVRRTPSPATLAAITSLWADATAAAQVWRVIRKVKREAPVGNRSWARWMRSTTSASGSPVRPFFMSLIIPWGIFARYVLGSGSQWPEPISILLMVVFTFIGAAASYRAGSHIAVAMVTDRLPAGLQRVAALVVHLVMLLLAVFMVVYGAKLCMETWGQSIAELPWMPVGFSYLPVPVGGLFTLLFVLEHMVYGPQNNRAIVRFDHDIDHGEGAN